MTTWFKQILIEAICIALFLLVAAIVPWWPLQLFCLVVVGYVFFLLFRNPRYFYRRLIHPLLWAFLLPQMTEGTVRLLGYSSQANAGGLVDVALEMGAPASPVAIAGLIVLCTAADLFTTWIEGKRQVHIIDSAVKTARIYVHPDGALDVSVVLALRSPPGGTMITGSKVRLGLFWGPELEAHVHPAIAGQASPPVTSGHALSLTGGQDAELTLVSDKKPVSGFGRRLWLRSSLPLAGYVHGTAWLVAVPSASAEAIRFTFRLERPPGGSAEVG